MDPVTPLDILRREHDRRLAHLKPRATEALLDPAYLTELVPWVDKEAWADAMKWSDGALVLELLREASLKAQGDLVSGEDF